jgi:hypothetical protein
VVDTAMDALPTVRKQEQADTDLLRGNAKLFSERVIGEEVEAICGAPYGARSEERTNRRLPNPGPWTPGPGTRPFRPEVGRNQGQDRTADRRSRNRSGPDNPAVRATEPRLLHPLHSTIRIVAEPLPLSPRERLPFHAQNAAFGTHVHPANPA